MGKGGGGFDLTGRTVLVTGASSGIGRHFARTLAKHGADVVVAARRVALLDEVTAMVAAMGRRALAVEMDVADEASTIAAYDAAEAMFGTIDSVVANAGINMPGSAMGIGIDDFDTTIAVNLRGVFLTVREGARRMVAAGVDRGHGRIVIISSVTAHHPSAGVVPYSATKAAITQMGRAMAKEWLAKGINVNMICPGYMLTDMTGDLWETEKGHRLLAGFGRGRLMGIDALDPMLLYLCADASAQVTGSVFTIDDGQTL